MPAIRLRRRWLLVGGFVLLLNVAIPLHISSPSGKTKAALLDLERRYGREGSNWPIYLEPGPYVPSGLQAIGQHPIAFLERREWHERFEGAEFTPDYRTVEVTEERGLFGIRYTVSVSSVYRGMCGTGRYFSYRQWCGFVWPADSW